MKSYLVIILLAIAIQVNCDGYNEPQYEPPAQKMKFNIGFNLPSMSISLPKLELPQISIKASVKQKKPFTLQLPVIKFNAHAATEEDDSYPPQPESYASAGPDTSPYASMSAGGGGAYIGPVPANMGYERPSAGQYGPPEQDSGYASSQQAPAAAAPYNNNQEQQNQYQPQPAQQQQQYQQQQPQQQQYQQQQQPQQYQQPQPAYVTNSAQSYSTQPAQYQSEPQQPSQYGFQGRSVADYRASTSANGYYVPKPTNSQNQQMQAPKQQYQQPQVRLQQLQSQPQQRQHQPQVQNMRRPIDDNLNYYDGAQLYQGSPLNQMHQLNQMNQMNRINNQAGVPQSNYEIITAPEFAKLYGSRLHSNFARRTSIRAPITDYETLWYAASSDQNPSVIPAPVKMAGWTPIA